MQSLLNANSFVILLHIWSIACCVCVRCCCPFRDVRIYLEHFTVRPTSKFEQITTNRSEKCTASANEPAQKILLFNFNTKYSWDAKTRATCDSETPHSTQTECSIALFAKSIGFIIIANIHILCFCVCARESSTLRNCQLDFELIFNRIKLPCLSNERVERTTKNSQSMLIKSNRQKLSDEKISNSNETERKN